MDAHSLEFLGKLFARRSSGSDHQPKFPSTTGTIKYFKSKHKPIGPNSAPAGIIVRRIKARVTAA